MFLETIIFLLVKKKLENVILRIVDYDKNFLEETLIDTVEEAFVYQEKKINNLV